MPKTSDPAARAAPRRRPPPRASPALLQELQALQALEVVHADEQVGGPHVVDPGHVLVADPLDAVGAEADVVERRALHRLDGHDAHAGVTPAQALSRRDRPRRAHGRDEGARLEAEGAHDLLGRRRRAVEVEAVVPDLLELVQDPVRGIGAQLADLVVDLLDVRLAARGRDHVRPVAADLLEALGAHLLGQHHARAVAHARADPGAADPEVAGRGEDERVLARGAHRVELLLHEDRVGGADLVGARREVAAREDDDRRADAGQGLGQDGERHRPVGLPREVPEVQRVEGAGAGLAGLLPQGGVDETGVPHLGEGGSEEHGLEHEHAGAVIQDAGVSSAAVGGLMRPLPPAVARRASPRRAARRTRPAPGPARAADTETVGRRGTNRTVLPVNQVVTPLGVQVELPGLRPQALALSPDGRLLVTAGKTSELVVVDPATGAVRQRVPLPKTKARAAAGAVGEHPRARQGRPAQLHRPAVLPGRPARVPERRQRLRGRVRRGGGRHAARRALDPPARRQRAPAQGGDPGRPGGVRGRHEALRLRQPVEHAAGAGRRRRPRAAGVRRRRRPLRRRAHRRQGLRVELGRTSPAARRAHRPRRPRHRGQGGPGEARRERGVGDGDRPRGPGRPGPRS